MDHGHQFDEHVNFYRWFGVPYAAYPKFDWATAMAELKEQIPADCKLVYETYNETVHGDEAITRLFGWGDHEWLRELTAPDAKTPLK